MHGLYPSSPPRGPSFLSKLGSFVEKLLLILLLLALAGLGWFFYREGKLPGQAKRPPPEVWARQTHDGLSVESPVLLGQGEDWAKQLPNSKTSQIENHSSLIGKAEDGFEVAYFFVKIDGRRTFSLEDGVAGLMAGMAKEFGVSKEQIVRRDVGVSGLPGRHLLFKGVSKGREMHFEGVVVQDSRKIWAISAAGPAPERAADVRRVLESVRIQRQ